MSRVIRDMTELKEALRARADIVKVIGHSVELHQRGRNFWGLCPFHGESTPSFNVTPEKNVWSCLGCREAGDIYSFVQRIHGVSFSEALSIIAELAGFDITPFYREQTPEEIAREGNYAIMLQLADHFHEQLVRSPQHVNFFAQKGITLETLRTFKIGYCPSVAWLEQILAGRPEVLALIDPSEGNRKVLFDGHLLYPQFTPTGDVWGWYARTDNPKMKYAGPSKDAPLFDGKARVYGLAQARRLLRKSELPMLILEGFHDAMAAHQIGLAAVASCGTELSADQIETLHSWSINEAIVIFDGDEGGAKGMLRLASRAHEINGTHLKFATIPGDPDEFIVGQGREAFVMVCKNAVRAVEFVVKHHANVDLLTPTNKLDFLDHIRPFLLGYPRTSISRTLGIQAVAQLLEVDSLVIADVLAEGDQDNPLSNVRAEKIALAEFAMNAQAWVLYADLLPRDFVLERHARTFDLMQTCYQLSGQVNIEVLLTEARNRRLDRSVTEVIEQLSITDRTRADFFIAEVRDKSLRRHARDVVAASSRTVGDLGVPVTETIGGLVESVTGLMVGRSTRNVLSSVEAVEQAVREFEQRSESESDIMGLDLGPDFSHLMSWLGGFRNGRVHLICALSGVGKSVFGVANVGYRLSVDAKGPAAAGLIASMEMSASENIERIVAVDTRVPHVNIRGSRFESLEQSNIVRAGYERVRDSRLTWMTGHQSAPSISLQARILQARGDLDYIIIDYAQLADLSVYNDRWQTHEKYGAFSDDILQLADNLQVPIIMIAQLSKDAMKEALPSGEQIAGAYDIYRDAHACLTLIDRGPKNPLIGNLDKNRGGPSHKTFDINFDRDPARASLRMSEGSLRTHEGPPQ